MKALRMPADPAGRVKAYLLVTLPTLIGEVHTVSVGGPGEDWDVDTSPPHVGIFNDGGPSRWPVATRPLLRVTAWSDGRTRSWDLAGLCMGVLLAHRIPGIANVREPSSILDDRDPKNDGLMASFTVRTTVRTLSV
ncbi:hypothetical protein L1080_004375 [Rhodococcus sp. MSC1_016]|uniref:hypothetical protein n=1 Tax=Rhodococcus sp. MSC1_016 TaxID=2909266 RepID=UPI002030223B|nr:hypothetical protein [Rhodococcus sp. MSC1_016]